jgi:hypothetical protein
MLAITTIALFQVAVSALPMGRVFGHLLPRDRTAEVPQRIVNMCATHAEQSTNQLLKQDAVLADSASQRGFHDSNMLIRLGCIRALLYVRKVPAREEHGQPVGASWGQGAINSLTDVLEQAPGNAFAAQLLSALSLSAIPVSLPAIEDFAEKSMSLRPPADPVPLAHILFASVRAGVRDGDVIRACTSLLLDIGDITAALECSRRGLEYGVDSTWHLLRLSYVSFLQGDTLAGVAQFQNAASVARDSLSRFDVAQHLDWERRNVSDLSHSRYVIDSLDTAGFKQWLGMSDSIERMTWLKERELRAIAREQISIAAILERHFRVVTYARGGFHDCINTVRIGPPRKDDFAPDGTFIGVTPDSAALLLPCHPRVDPSLRTIPATAALLRFWDPASGGLTGVVSYSIPLSGLIENQQPTQSTLAIELDVRQSGVNSSESIDTSVSKRLQVAPGVKRASSLTGIVPVRVNQAPSTWSMTIAQDRYRFGVVTGASESIDDGPLMLSDIALGAPSQGQTWRLGTDGISLMPLGEVNHRDLLELFVQARSDIRRADLRLALAVYRTERGVRAPAPTIQVTSKVSMPAGITPIKRTIDLTKLPAGTYVLMLSLSDSTINVQRTSALILR